MHFVTTVDRHFTTAPTGRPWLATCPPSHFASSSSLSLWPSSSSCPAFAKRWVVHVYSQTAPILAAVESLIAWLTILSERQETFTRSCSSYLPEPTPDECQWFRNRNLQSCRIASARTTSFFIRITVDIQKRERIYTQHLFFFYFHFFFQRFTTFTTVTISLFVGAVLLGKSHHHFWLPSDTCIYKTVVIVVVVVFFTQSYRA